MNSLPPPSNSLYEQLFGEMNLECLVLGQDSAPALFGHWLELQRAAKAWFRNDHEEARKRATALVQSQEVDSVVHAAAWQLLKHVAPDTLDAVLASLPLGAVVELGHASNPEVLGAYRDHSAAYCSAGQFRVLPRDDDQEINREIDVLLQSVRPIVAKTPPLQAPRTGLPPTGIARLTVLTPAGPRVAMGALEHFARDRLTEPVLRSTLALIHLLQNRE